MAYSDDLLAGRMSGAVTPELKVRGLCDIVIALDITGSMTPCIEQLKANLSEHFLQRLQVPSAMTQIKLDWRVRIVGYRDVAHDGTAAMEMDMPFTTDAAQVLARLSAMQAKGGGDAAESMLDAVYTAALKSDWRPKAHRFILVFTDAPTHPTLHPSTVETGADTALNAVIQSCTMNKIKLHIVGPDCPEYVSLGAIPGAMFYSIGPADSPKVYEGLVNQRFDSLLDYLAKTVSISASAPVRA